MAKMYLTRDFHGRLKGAEFTGTTRDRRALSALGIIAERQKAKPAAAGDTTDGDEQPLEGEQKKPTYKRRDMQAEA